MFSDVLKAWLFKYLVWKMELHSVRHLHEFKNLIYIWTQNSSSVLPSIVPVHRHTKFNERIWLKYYREILKNHIKSLHLKKKMNASCQDHFSPVVKNYRKTVRIFVWGWCTLKISWSIHSVLFPAFIKTRIKPHRLSQVTAVLSLNANS